MRGLRFLILAIVTVAGLTWAALYLLEPDQPQPPRRIIAAAWELQRD